MTFIIPLTLALHYKLIETFFILVLIRCLWLRFHKLKNLYYLHKSNMRVVKTMLASCSKCV